MARTEKMKAGKGRKTPEAQFERLPEYLQTRLDRQTERLTVARYDEKLQIGAETLTILFALAQQLYTTDLEIKGLLGLKVKP